MILKELKFKSNPLCYCHHCGGTGLIPLDLLNIRNKIGVLCSYCNGTGYEEIPLSNKVKVYIDEDELAIYKVVNGEIIERVSFFKKMLSARLYSYIIHNDTAKHYNIHYEETAEYFRAKNEDFFVSYYDFSHGKIPKSPSNPQHMRALFNPEVNNYEVTNNEMVLKLMRLGDSVLCNCCDCNGSGILTRLFDTSKNIGLICHTCRGTGYKKVNLGGDYRVVRETKKGLTYFLECGLITKRAYLFDGLVEKKGIEYVIYDSSSIFIDDYKKSVKDYFIDGISKDEIISYHKFLIGRLPLPMEKYSCPYYFTKDYADYEFDNDCSYKTKNKGFTKCPDYESGICWKMFYGDAKTVGEKQEVLRRLRKK